MEDELQKDEIIPAETVTESTGMQPDTPEVSGEISTTETSDPSSELEKLRAENKELRGFQDKVRDLAETNQQAAAFLHDMITTGSIGVALNENYSEEEVMALLKEARSSEYEEIRNSYQTKVEGKKAYMAHQEENMKLTQTGAEEFMEEMSISEEEETAFIAFTDEFLMDAADNKLTKVRWMQLWKAFKHDSAVAEAEENGKIMGKNEKISTGKKTREDLKHEMPEGGSAADTTPVKKQTYAESLNTSSPLKKLKL